MSGKTFVIIPARFGSTRFPGKVLAELHGKPLIQWVYEKARDSVADDVVVATDHPRVMAAVTAFGGKAVMTAVDHPSGTDRICEAADKIGCGDRDIIVNIQGDEPLLPISVINDLIAMMRENPGLEMGTVAAPRPRAEIGPDPNRVKVIFGADGAAIYFSRSMIPYLREGGEDTPCYLHWGIYAYRGDVLRRFVRLPEGRLEQCEKLEQLRALENGIRIQVLISELESIGVDTPADLERARRKLEEILPGMN
ncbi:MAG: 3-deoxy-manno-octulosonate cytidylyltransferase [Victivallales bacterium]|nr:3-deoxy-manno-octulosonate cytidylyltransferase [Victivallales bacterium]